MLSILKRKARTDVTDNEKIIPSAFKLYKVWGDIDHLQASFGVVEYEVKEAGNGVEYILTRKVYDKHKTSTFLNKRYLNKINFVPDQFGRPQFYVYTFEENLEREKVNIKSKILEHLCMLQEHIEKEKEKVKQYSI